MFLELLRDAVVASKTADIALESAMAIQDIAMHEYTTNIMKAENKIVTEAEGTSPEDLKVIMGEFTEGARKGLIGHIQDALNAIKEAIKKFLAMIAQAIKNTIGDKVMATVTNLKNKIDKNPKLADEEIEVADYEAMDDAVSAYNALTSKNFKKYIASENAMLDAYDEEVDAAKDKLEAAKKRTIKITVKEAVKSIEKWVKSIKRDTDADVGESEKLIIDIERSMSKITGDPALINRASSIARESFQMNKGLASSRISRLHAYLHGIRSKVGDPDSIPDNVATADPVIEKMNKEKGKTMKESALDKISGDPYWMFESCKKDAVVKEEDDETTKKPKLSKDAQAVLDSLNELSDDDAEAVLDAFDSADDDGSDADDDTVEESVFDMLARSMAEFTTESAETDDVYASLAASF